MPLSYALELPRPLRRLKDAIAFRGTRAWIYQRFWETMQPTAEMRVADFGVSGRRDGRNRLHFELAYPWRHQVTAIGRAEEQAGWYAEELPGLTFLEADLRSIPLPDNYFDIGICNAVVEHAGTYDEQLALVREVCRVSRSVMFTTPNKSFPVEVHTFVPFAHWLPDQQFRAVLRTLGHHDLARIDQLNPLDAPTFLSLFPADRQTRLEKVGPPLLKSNLVCVSTAR
jgi:Methyltransferase domain